MKEQVGRRCMEQSVEEMALTRKGCGTPREERKLEQKFLYYTGRFHAAEPFVEAVVIENESSVIKAKAVQQSGVEVVHTDAIVDGVITEVIGFPIRGTTLDTAPGQPD